MFVAALMPAPTLCPPAVLPRKWPALSHPDVGKPDPQKLLLPLVSASRFAAVVPPVATGAAAAGTPPAAAMPAGALLAIAPVLAMFAAVEGPRRFAAVTPAAVVPPTTPAVTGTALIAPVPSAATVPEPMP